jgi:hypothetical protein
LPCLPRTFRPRRADAAQVIESSLFALFPISFTETVMPIEMDPGPWHCVVGRPGRPGFQEIRMYGPKGIADIDFADPKFATARRRRYLPVRAARFAMSDDHDQV